MKKIYLKNLAVIYDECHHLGAEVFSALLKTSAKYTLGLSATSKEQMD